MERFFGRYEIYVYSIFRIVFGMAIMLHGSQKLFGWPSSKSGGSVQGLMLVAGVIEMAGGLLVTTGLFSSIAAFVLSGMLAVAYFMVHQPGGALPIMNGGELAAAYCFGFLYIAARGSGVWSIDWLIRGSGRAGRS